MSALGKNYDKAAGRFESQEDTSGFDDDERTPEQIAEDEQQQLERRIEIYNDLKQQ
jgi:hypothetical protein